MAKKKDKLPKRIAGVKIPKAIRRGPIGDFLSSSGGQLLLAEVLLAVSAVYGARRFDASTPTGDALRHPLESLRTGRDWSRAKSDRFVSAFNAGVQAFRAALHESPANGNDVASSAAASSEDDRQSKKSGPRSEASLRDASSSGPH